MSAPRARQRALNLLTALVLVFHCWCVARHVAAPATRPGLETLPAHHARLPELRININHASEAELSLLPGIGPNLAQRIVTHRNEHGPFADLSQLDRVSGVGAKIIQRLTPYAIVKH